ncbi:MAG: efflux RND transporter permease subunit, partial [Desulfobacterales bacterium]|nr:efflux RND transporter permease subunit [Desulfobacterales bacterium]
MNSVMTYLAENRVFANIIFVTVMLAGVTAVSLMVREDLPVMAHDTVEVTIVWEGADPVNVEEGVLRKIEMATRGLDGVLDIRTVAEYGIGRAVFLVASGSDPEAVFDRIRTRVNAISGFPEDAEKPVIDRPVQSFAVMTLFLNGDVTEKDLKSAGLVLRDELQRLPTVSKVFLDGVREDEISVAVSQETLRKYGVTIGDIAGNLARNNLDTAGGEIRQAGTRFAIRTSGRKDSAGQIGDIIAVTGSRGERIPLKDIAEVTDGFINKNAEVRVNGTPGILINIHKTRTEDAIEISRAVRAYLTRKEGGLPPGIDTGILFDASTATTERIGSLIKNGGYGLICVLIILWLFIDAGLAFWVAAGIPFSILGGLAVLWATGGTLNMVSLFSLIMVLGIIADDAIVTGEAILYHRERGLGPLEAVTSGVREVGMPVIVAVATNVVAFVPLLFIPGMMGRFIAVLPVTVIACLLMSLLECFVLLPAHLNHGKPVSGTGGNRRGNNSRRAAGRLERIVSRWYTPFLSTVLRYRYATLCCGVSLLFISAGMLMGGFLPFDLFPENSGRVITATVEFPAGTGIEKTRSAVEDMELALSQSGGTLKDRNGKPVIESQISLTGHLLGDEAGEVEESDPRFGSVQAVLVPAARRSADSMEIIAAWQAAMPDMAGARSVHFFTDSVGMPEAPIVIHLLGSSSADLVKAGDEVKQWLQGFDAVYQVRSDAVVKANEIQLALRPSARPLGLSLADLSNQVKDSYFGRKALTLQRGQEEVDVYVRLDEAERRDFSSLERLRITTPDGEQVPLSAVASVSMAEGRYRIERKNRLRKVSISAWVRGEEATADDIMDVFEERFAPEFTRQFPHVTIQEGGDEDEENMTFDSLIYGFP